MNDQKLLVQTNLEIQAKTDWAQWSDYRSLLQAAETLAIQPDDPQGDTIVDRLLKLSFSYFRVKKADWGTPPEPVVRSARETLTRTDLGRVVDRFETLIQETPSRKILFHAAHQLLRIQPGNRCAIAAIVFYALQPDPKLPYPSYWYRHPLWTEALRAIVENPLRSDAFTQAISQVLIGDAEPSEMLQTLETLIQIDPEHPFVLIALLDFTWRNTEPYDDYFPHRCIPLSPDLERLWQSLYRRLPHSFDILVQIISSPEVSLRYLTALQVLQCVAPGHEVTAHLAIDLLIQEREDPYFSIKRVTYLIDIISEIGVASTKVLTTLTQIFNTTQCPEIKYLTAVSLKRLDIQNSEATSFILETLHDFADRNFETFTEYPLYPHSSPWQLHAKALVFEDLRPLAIDLWERAIQQNPGHWSSDLIQAIGSIPDAIITYWSGQLVKESSENSEFFDAMILRLLRIAKHNPNQISHLEDFIQTNVNQENLFKAARILLEQNSENTLAIRTLEAILVDTTLEIDREDDFYFYNHLFFKTIDLLRPYSQSHQLIRNQILQRLNYPGQSYHQIVASVRSLIQTTPADVHLFLFVFETLKQTIQRSIEEDRFWDFQDPGSFMPIVHWLKTLTNTEFSEVLLTLRDQRLAPNNGIYPTYQSIEEAHVRRVAPYLERL